MDAYQLLENRHEKKTIGDAFIQRAGAVKHERRTKHAYTHTLIFNVLHSSDWTEHNFVEISMKK